MPDDARPSMRAALRDLRYAQKSNRGAPAYSRWVNRPLGRVTAAVAYSLRLRPNHVTAVSATFTFAALILLAVRPASWTTGIVVALLLVVGYVFDAADGQLARLRGGGSPAGEWLDHVIDCTKCACIHVAVLISWYRSFDLSSESLLLIPIAFGVQASVWFFAIGLTQQLRQSRIPAPPQRTVSQEPAPVLRSILVVPADYGALCVSFVLLGWHRAFFYVYTLLMIANVLFLLLSLVRWYREMVALPAQAARNSESLTPNAS
jgi:phosphatidylglycerophosphate synthase